MSILFKSDNKNTRVFGRIKDIPKATKQALRRGMFKTGKTLVSTTSTEILKGKKSGRVYVFRDRLGRRRRHRASAPGETHANLTGAARRSLSFQLKGALEMEFGYGVSAGKEAPEYAKFLEFGTTRMKARPSLKNGLKKEQSNFVRNFTDELDGALK